MNLDEIRIQHLHLSKEQDISPQSGALLLLADPSWEMIRTYLPGSEVIEAYLGEILAGCLLIKNIDKDVAEIKNIAVREDFQGQGLGSILLKAALTKAAAMGKHRLIIRTANSSIGQLYLYQKMGFRIRDIEPDFFTVHYPEPIWENGLLCRDRITLSQEL